jgi:hypothetical protein
VRGWARGSSCAGCGRRKGRGAAASGRLRAPGGAGFGGLGGCGPSALAAGRRWPGSGRRLDAGARAGGMVRAGWPAMMRSQLRRPGRCGRWRRGCAGFAGEDQPFSSTSGTGAARPHQLGCGMVSTTTASRAVRARAVRGGDRVRHRSAHRGPDRPAGAEMLLAAAGSATAVRLLTFRCGRGRSSGQPGTNDCWRSRLIVVAARDFD